MLDEVFETPSSSLRQIAHVLSANTKLKEEYNKLLERQALALVNMYHKLKLLCEFLQEAYLYSCLRSVKGIRRIVKVTLETVGFVKSYGNFTKFRRHYDARLKI